eukprot:8816071-Pyramimonas_sp.AAC.1
MLIRNETCHSINKKRTTLSESLPTSADRLISTQIVQTHRLVLRCTNARDGQSAPLRSVNIACFCERDASQALSPIPPSKHQSQILGGNLPSFKKRHSHHSTSYMYMYSSPAAPSMLLKDNTIQN